MTMIKKSNNKENICMTAIDVKKYYTDVGDDLNVDEYGDEDTDNYDDDDDDVHVDYDDVEDVDADTYADDGVRLE